MNRFIELMSSSLLAAALSLSGLVLLDASTTEAAPPRPTRAVSKHAAAKKQARRHRVYEPPMTRDEVRASRVHVSLGRPESTYRLRARVEGIRRIEERASALEEHITRLRVDRIVNRSRARETKTHEIRVTAIMLEKSLNGAFRALYNEKDAMAGTVRPEGSDALVTRLYQRSNRLLDRLYEIAAALEDLQNNPE